MKDNGPGFTKDKIDEILRRIEKLKESGLDSEDKTAEIGIINVFSRLYLRYQNNLIFKIENADTRGAKITIGGII